MYGGPISSNAISLFHVSLIRTIAESPLKEGENRVGNDDSTVQASRRTFDSGNAAVHQKWNRAALALYH